MKQLYIRKFPFRNGIPSAITVQNVPENSLKTLLLSQISQQKSFFSSFFINRKLIDDSSELSGVHLCLRTVHLTLHN